MAGDNPDSPEFGRGGIAFDGENPTQEGCLTRFARTGRGDDDQFRSQPLDLGLDCPERVRRSSTRIARRDDD